MKLFLLRHTTAADPHAYAQDADRPLTEAGREEAAAVARCLKALDGRIQLVLTSPYARARETARIVAQTLTLEPPEDSGLLLPGADPTALIAHLSQRRADSILMVGHAPDLSYFISTLCVGDEHVMPAMGKGSVALVDVERPIRKRRAHLKALIPLSVSEHLARTS